MARPPFRINEFIGHKRLLAPIWRIQDGAMARGETMPHVLLTGQSGTGKSLFAGTLAQRGGTKIIKLVGKTPAEEIALRLVECRRGDFLFLDEAHNLDQTAQELCFEVIDSSSIPARLVSEGKLDLVRGTALNVQKRLQSTERYESAKADANAWANLGRLLADLPGDLQKECFRFFRDRSYTLPPLRRVKT
jgi:hypothetical protein